MRFQYLIPTLTLLLLPSLAFGYVDPTVLGAFYQLAYAAVFTFLTFLIFKPWARIKSTVLRVFRSDRKTEKPGRTDSI